MKLSINSVFSAALLASLLPLGAQSLASSPVTVYSCEGFGDACNGEGETLSCYQDIKIIEALDGTAQIQYRLQPIISEVVASLQTYESDMPFGRITPETSGYDIALVSGSFDHGEHFFTLMVDKTIESAPAVGKMVLEQDFPMTVECKITTEQ